MTKRIEPTSEDYDRARASIADAERDLLDHLARSEPHKRIERERLERRRGRLRRLTFGFLGR